VLGYVLASALGTRRTIGVHPVTAVGTLEIRRLVGGVIDLPLQSFDPATDVPEETHRPGLVPCGQKGGPDSTLSGRSRRAPPKRNFKAACQP